MKTKHHGQMSESFLTAVFLSLSGGLQDAYTYLFRGKVFANAQTGNIVLLSANIMDGRRMCWRSCWHSSRKGGGPMDRKGLEQLIFDTYSVEPDYPWMDTPESAVFRHAANRKWFALVTTVPRSKLGLPGQQPVDIVNLKCDPILIGSLRAEPGFYPAYHMNKENWITAALDGSAPEDKLRLVLDMSYNATATKLRKKKA